MACFHVYWLYLGLAERVILQGRRFPMWTLHGSDVPSHGACRRQWKYKMSTLRERESQSLFTYSHTSARTVCLSLCGVKANVLGQRTVTEQMLLAEPVTHSNLANFPAEICVQLSHGFASFTHFCVFKHLQMLEDGIVERNKEEQSTGDGGWWHCPRFSCTSRKGGEAISPSQTLNSANSLHLCLKAHRSCLETLSSKIVFNSALR